MSTGHSEALGDGYLVDFVEHVLGFILLIVVDEVKDLLLKDFVSTSEAFWVYLGAHTNADG